MTFLNYHIEHPWLIWSLFFLLPLYWSLIATSRKRSVIAYPPLQYKKSSIFPKLFFNFSVFVESLLLVTLIISLAKPYKATEITSIEEEGIDIVLVVDVSASMQALDFNPNRLEATKEIITDFVRRSGGDRIGIVVFGKHSFILSPMTTDHIVLKDLIGGLSLYTINQYKSGGTAIGDAILRATELMKKIKMPDRDQVIILLTDGDNNEGIDPLIAAKHALENDIKIHTIGLGSTELIEVRPNPKDSEWHFESKLVEEPLIKIAEICEGRYFHATTENLLSDIFNEISILEKTPLEVDRISQRKYYRYPLNVFLAVLFILALFTRVLLIRRPLK